MFPIVELIAIAVVGILLGLVIGINYRKRVAEAKIGVAEDKAVKIVEDAKKEAEAKIAKTDKRRATYYNHYTSIKWGQAKNYHLSVDSAALGVEGTAALLRDFAAAYRKRH